MRGYPSQKRHYHPLARVLAALCVLQLALPARVALADPVCQVYVTIARGGMAPPAEDPAPCALAQSMANRIVGAPDQMRPYLRLDPVLQLVAQAKAEDMAARGYFSHVDPDGYGPNYWASQAGYPLPASYDQRPQGNNIESLAAGSGDCQAIWQAWMASTGHRTHILGQTTFFAAQVDYGIGYVYAHDSPYQHYWVFISATKD